MEGVKAWLLALASLVLVSVALPAAASAQCRLCEEPTYAPADQHAEGETIGLQIEAGLDFDQLVVLGIGSGSAEINTDGSRFAQGAVTAISSRAMVGMVTVYGEPGRRLEVTLPDRIELWSTSGERLILESIRDDLPDHPRLDDRGELQFRFGGRLLVEGGLEGDFRGDLAISVEYL